MGADDKVDNAMQRTKGKAKEAAGAVTDDQDLRTEGRADQTESDVKDAGEHVKDAARKAGEAFKH